MDGSRWSPTVREHFLEPRNAGPLPFASGEGWAGDPATGRYMRIQVQLEGTRVVDARFGTFGCAFAIACGSYLTEFARGLEINRVREMTADRLANALGGIPPGRRFCASLAVDAMRVALDTAERSSERDRGQPAPDVSTHPHPDAGPDRRL